MATNQIQLGPRHQRIANLVLQGKSQKQIAVLLGLSVRTVETYIAQIGDGLKTAGCTLDVPPMRRILLSYERYLTGDVARQAHAELAALAPSE